MGKTTDQNTAILFFTLSASEEAKVKSFTTGQGSSANRAVAQKLISSTYKTIADAGLPVFTVSSSQQMGNTFGERFSNAFAALFEVGYENVIAVGNDCPELSCARISKAEKSLQHSSFVIGPATDGGAYLIALSRQSFNKEKFRGLSWNTDHLLADLIDHTKRVGYSFTLLDELADIDDSSDLFSIIHRLRQKAGFSFLMFVETLKVLLSSVYITCNPTFKLPCNLIFLGNSYSHRGPPLHF